MNFTRRILGVLALLFVAVLLAGVPVVLWWLTGPLLPDAIPTGSQILDALTSRDDGTLIAVVLLVVAWLAWLYLAIALLVEIWAAIRRVPAPRMPGFSLPQGAARKLVGAAMLAFIAGPALAGTANADTTTVSPPAQTVSATTISTTPAAEDTSSSRDTTMQAPTRERATTTHVVGPQDSLYSLAATYLDDGDRYMEIFEANRGVVQANGSKLTDPDLIVNGTELTITLDTPAAAPQAAAAKRATIDHTVEPGDTLYELAEDHLDDGDRYMEIFEANRGVVQANGSKLTDPDLIISGTELTITLDTPAAAPAAATPTTDQPKPSQVETAEEPQEPETAAPSKQQPAATQAPPTPEPAPTPQPARAEIGSSQSSASQPIIHDTVSEDDSDDIGVRAPIGVGALAASGVVGLIASRRFYQRRQRARGAQLAMPTGAAAVVERELRAVANPLAIEEVDLALRGLAKHCRDTNTPLPEIRVARLTGTTFEIYTTEAETLPAPWIGTASGMLWSYHADDTDQLDRDALSEIPAPFPALVCLGQDLEDAHVLADLETVGSINIDADKNDAEEILAAMAIELATSSWADDLTVTVVGAFPEMEDVLQTGRIRYLPTVGRLFDELQRRADNDRLALQLDDAPDLHHARVSAVAPSTWFPEVIMLTQPLTDTQQNQLERLLTELPRVAIASVAIDSSPADWTINTTSGDNVILEPLGLTIIPQRISTEGYRRVLEVVDVANHGQPIYNETHPDIIDTLVDDATDWLNAHTGREDDLPDEGEPVAIAVDVEDAEALQSAQLAEVDASVEEPEDLDVSESVEEAEQGEEPEKLSATFGPTEGVPYLRVLGTVELEGAGGVVEPNRAARLTEYLAYLALTEDTVTARSIDDAIWPNRKKENNATTRDPATSRLRKWLGTDEDGQLRLDVNTFELTGIDCDWYQFEAATRGPLTGVSTEQLAAAVRLVRGTPFKSAAVRNRYYSWAEPIQQAMISRIVDVCYELALRQLVDEEWLACEATLATGIDIEPGDEQLWRMRILAAYARHNREAVEEATSRLFAQLEGFDCPPEPETTDFLRHLDEGATVTDLMEMI